jgi:hypothetical protein
MMKGGAYTTAGTYLRKKGDSTLYELTMDVANEERKVYTLDFTKAEGARVSVMKAIPQFLINKEYSNAFIKAFGITDTVNTNAVKIMIEKLFAGGVEGAKTRKLIITEMPSSVDIELTENDVSKHTVTVTKDTGSSFEGYLRTLGEGIMPFQSSTTQ